MTFFVAEIGVNWDGSFELAKQMIEKSKEAGCDAVKFQAFTEEMVKDHPAHARLIKSSISKTNIEIIVKKKNDVLPIYILPFILKNWNLLVVGKFEQHSRSISARKIRRFRQRRESRLPRAAKNQKSAAGERRRVARLVMAGRLPDMVRPEAQPIARQGGDR